MSTRNVISVSITRNVVTTKIPCNHEVADMQMSKEIDLKVKEIIVNEPMLSPSTTPSTKETSLLPGPSTSSLPGPSTPSLPSTQDKDKKFTTKKICHFQHRKPAIIFLEQRLFDSRMF